ncbi:MAG: hypothetical protein GSR86_06400 [Desulfurococcales archaeon]|nr:hypothetical protein [Desulfurococcales archaeon]
MPIRLEGAFKVEGPAHVKVLEGEVYVVGGLLGEGGELVVPVGRTYPGYTSNAVVEVSPDTGRISEYSDDEYWSLDSLSKQIASSRNPIIVGPTDSGKSTLAAWTYNNAVRSGRGMAIATTDIGQNELYCPGFIAVARPSSGIALPGGGYQVSSSCFVGSFTPSGHEHQYLMCASSIASTGEVVVDTDGWITPWRGLGLKAALAQVLGSGVIVAVGLDEAYSRYLEDVTGVEVLRVAGRRGKGKSREERRRHRERLLARHLVGGRVRSFKVGEPPIYGAPIFMGKPIPPGEVGGLQGIVYAEVGPEGVVVVARKSGRRHTASSPKVLPLGWERGVLASIRRGSMAYPALVDRINYHKRTIGLYTRYEGEADYIELGSVKVDIDSYTGRV